MKRIAKNAHNYNALPCFKSKLGIVIPFFKREILIKGSRVIALMTEPDKRKLFYTFLFDDRWMASLPWFGEIFLSLSTQRAFADSRPLIQLQWDLRSAQNDNCRNLDLRKSSYRSPNRNLICYSNGFWDCLDCIIAIFKCTMKAHNWMLHHRTSPDTKKESRATH